MGDRGDGDEDAGTEPAGRDEHGAEVQRTVSFVRDHGEINAGEMTGLDR